MVGVLAMPNHPAIAVVILIVPILMIIGGLCSLLWPRLMWWLSEGWKFKNIEPSGCALIATRIGGLRC
jgi:hypothetical protein